METPGQTIQGHTVVRMDEVALGDYITETDTPQGEWYEVTRMTSKTLWVTTDDGFELRFGRSHRAIVLRKGC